MAKKLVLALLVVEDTVSTDEQTLHYVDCNCPLEGAVEALPQLHQWLSEQTIVVKVKHGGN